MKRNRRPLDVARGEAVRPSDRTVPKTAPSIISFAPGSTWLLDTSRVVITHQPNVREVIVRHLATDEIEKVAISRLKSVVPRLSSLVGSTSHKPLEHHSPVVWSRALQEEGLIRTLLDSGDLSPKARTDVATTLGISDRQLRRKLRRYGELQTAAAFLPQKTGPATGSHQLHPRLEALIREEIAEALKVSPDISVDDLYPLIDSIAKGIGLRPPGRSTVSRRLRAARLNTDNLPSSIGAEIKYLQRPVRGSHTAEAPLHIVEMDHTVADVHIVNPRSGQPIGRAALSLVIDRITRVILGMLLSLEAPSRLSVGLCLHHAVMPKDPWLRSLGIPDACWPGYGLMHQVYTDNAQEFHALSLQRACQIYGIQMAFRPPGDPAAGGIVERAIGTFMTKVRLLPGSSYSKLLGKAPKNVHRSARFTLPELELYIAREISRYHKTKHNGIGMPPLTAWERGWTVNGTAGSPRLPDSGDKFLVSFLPGEWRTITREGIELFSLRYRSSDLAPLISPGRKRMVRYDPRNLSRVFVETDEAHLIVPLAEVAGQQFSIWEWNEIHRQEFKAGRSRDPEAIAGELMANRSLIAKAAKRSGRTRDAKRLARQDEWQCATAAEQPISQVLTVPLPDAPFICRVQE